MQLKEALNHIAYALGELGYAAPPTGILIGELNSNANHIAMELNFPTRYVKDVDATAAFTFPDEARTNGIYYAEDSSSRFKLDLLSIEEANKKYPDWEDYLTSLGTFGAKFLLIDQKNESASVIPFGFSAGETINLLYVKTVTDVSAMTDVFWDGELLEYHDLIVDRFMYRHLRLKKDSSGTGYKADYQERLEDAFAYLQHEAHDPVVSAIRQRAFEGTFKNIYRWS